MGAFMAFAIEHRSLSNKIPSWVSQDVRLYLDHIEGGVTIRALARDHNVHASTILRKVRKTEGRRDDPLVDRVLIHLGKLRRNQGQAKPDPQKVPTDMTDTPPDAITLKRDAIRILRALMQPGAVLAVVPDVETAVVVRESTDGRPRQVATLARPVAEAMALQNWISCEPKGRVSRYYINQNGRMALNRFLAEQESEKAGFSEASAHFAGLDGADPDGQGVKAGKLRAISGGRGKRRTIGAEAPLQVLARRRTKSGQTYISPELVETGERLRMDFELAQITGPVASDWQGLTQIGTNAAQVARHDNIDPRQASARKRLEKALRFLGPELGEVALITCCEQNGMEHAEKELHMPARSGKYVLRIALNMLARHYESEGGDGHNLIF